MDSVPRSPFLSVFVGPIVSCTRNAYLWNPCPQSPPERSFCARQKVICFWTHRFVNAQCLFMDSVPRSPFLSGRFVDATWLLLFGWQGSFAPSGWQATFPLSGWEAIFAPSGWQPIFAFPGCQNILAPSGLQGSFAAPGWQASFPPFGWQAIFAPSGYFCTFWLAGFLLHLLPGRQFLHLLVGKVFLHRQAGRVVLHLQAGRLVFHLLAGRLFLTFWLAGYRRSSFPRGIHLSNHGPFRLCAVCGLIARSALALKSQPGSFLLLCAG